jgi:glucose/arabinose dehydrogenase
MSREWVRVLLGVILAAVLTSGCLFVDRVAEAQSGAAEVLRGRAAFTDASMDHPGLRRVITVADLPAPYATQSVANVARPIARPDGAWPQAPAGFSVQLYASGLKNPRNIVAAPNGDIFVAESEAGRIRVFRGVSADGSHAQMQTFATGLSMPFGLAFYPNGSDPQYLYVGNTDSLVRFQYRNGDLQARGVPEVIVPSLPTGGHWTRNVIFSKDGSKMFVAVGSSSNVSDAPRENHRANILEFTPEGKNETIYAAGIRNPVGLALDPRTGELWTSVNERDGLGDNLVPDYITHVTPGGFYGWPWFYMGPHPDPTMGGRGADRRDQVIVPDVLLEAHSASLCLTFYNGAQFPAEYRGDIFASEHGSWNRSRRTGYKVIHVPAPNGKATGEYEDFLTGFVTASGEVWGRPVGVTVAQDGALLVADDAGNAVWRVSYQGNARPGSGH